MADELPLPRGTEDDLVRALAGGHPGGRSRKDLAGPPTSCRRYRSSCAEEARQDCSLDRAGQHVKSRFRRLAGEGWLSSSCAYDDQEVRMAARTGNAESRPAAYHPDHPT